jgi:hypothetical protein
MRHKLPAAEKIRPGGRTVFGPWARLSAGDSASHPAKPIISNSATNTNNPYLVFILNNSFV